LGGAADVTESPPILPPIATGLAADRGRGDPRLLRRRRALTLLGL
jgi:hypothetical protein